MDETLIEEQSLRLLRAFCNVRDNNARELLIDLAESAERGLPISATVDGSPVGAKRPT